MDPTQRDRLIREATQWKANGRKPTEEPPPTVTARPLLMGGTAAGILLAVCAALYLMWVFSSTPGQPGHTRVPVRAAMRPIVAAQLPMRALHHPHVIYVQPSPRPQASDRPLETQVEVRGQATYVPPPPGPNAGNVTI